mmetsp:Transcript_25548/g.29552  ORF Transcript_25548/g.29552 Transcript_25548/m.29552 type:complete len:210 (+) Transcript_25548:45-674(+)
MTVVTTYVRTYVCTYVRTCVYVCLYVCLYQQCFISLTGCLYIYRTSALLCVSSVLFAVTLRYGLYVCVVCLSVCLSVLLVGLYYISKSKAYIIIYYTILPLYLYHTLHIFSPFLFQFNTVCYLYEWVRRACDEMIHLFLISLSLFLCLFFFLFSLMKEPKLFLKIDTIQYNTMSLSSLLSRHRSIIFLISIIPRMDRSYILFSFVKHLR